jgi:hypothetical protein
LAEFKYESFIVSPPEVSAGLYAAILNSCQQHGFTPKIGQQAPQIVSILSLVAAIWAFLWCLSLPNSSKLKGLNINT